MKELHIILVSPLAQLTIPLKKRMPTGKEVPLFPKTGFLCECWFCGKLLLYHILRKDSWEPFATVQILVSSLPLSPSNRQLTILMGVMYTVPNTDNRTTVIFIAAWTHFITIIKRKTIKTHDKAWVIASRGQRPAGVTVPQGNCKTHSRGEEKLFEQQRKFALNKSYFEELKQTNVNPTQGPIKMRCAVMCCDTS